MNSESVIRRLAGSVTISDGGDGHGRRAQQIMVVGLSSNPGRPSYRVARSSNDGISNHSHQPCRRGDLGRKRYSIRSRARRARRRRARFPRSQHVPKIASEAARLSIAPVIWMQEGIVSEEAAQIAADAGMDVVMNRCMWKEVQRLQGSITTYLGRG